ncbi:MAG TPA: hypothetical protein VFB21_17700 [Chthonomonadaceae bacterium]|nr:hypothetical protein [Chthonomonadaceae bacterium]
MNQERIACPRCRANNFVGQAQCWQCRAPLPQQAVPARMPAAPPVPFAPPPRHANLVWLLLPIVAVIAFLAVFYGLGVSRPSEEAAQVVKPPLPASDLPPASSPTSAPVSADPITAQAQREIERARQDYNLPAPAPGVVSPDGKVHLRGGGTLRPDEWEAARRKLQDSPILRQPPVPIIGQ